MRMLCMVSPFSKYFIPLSCMQYLGNAQYLRGRTSVLVAIFMMSSATLSDVMPHVGPPICVFADATIMYAYVENLMLCAYCL